MHAQSPELDALFSKLVVIYGRDFLSRWQGLNMDIVKRDWAAELGPLLYDDRAVMHALSILDPAKPPPTVIQFRALCRSCPPRVTRYLPPPKMAPAEAAPHVARARAMRQAIAARAAEKALQHAAAAHA